MKVGTDGVLLGVWAPIANQTGNKQSPMSNEQSPLTNILDIGTGSGLIALMLAQRCPSAHIDAIDIDAEAVAQAKENFADSVFRLQLSAFQSRLQDWQIVNDKWSDSKCVNGKWSNGKLYDLIVSNPPYFQNSLKNPDPGRKTARHTDSLSFEELIAHTVRLLAENGVFALILPAEAEEEIRTIASAAGLQLVRVTRVYSKESKPARRVLLAFCRQPSALSHQFSAVNHQPSAVSPIEESLVLEDEIGGRSAAYSKLCEEFYL